jgi:Phage P2 GpU
MTGALGPVIFSGGLGEMNDFHAIQKHRKETFVKHRVIQANDLIESTGSDPIELSVEMHFHAPYTLAPSIALNALEALQEAKIPVPLIVGSTPVGRGFLSLFVVEEISTKMSKFIAGSLIIGDIDVKLLEYPNAFGLSGPLSALGGALPGLSNAVASLTNIASTATGVLNLSAALVPPLAVGTGVLKTLSGSGPAAAITSLVSSLKPGNVVSITAASPEQVQAALANVRAAGF